MKSKKEAEMGINFMILLYSNEVEFFYYVYIHKENVGVAESEKMILRGISLEVAEKIFSREAYNYEISLDQNQIKKIHGNQ